MDYDVVVVPEATYAVTRRTIGFSDVPQVMPGLMEKVLGWAATVPHGAVMCVSSVTPEGLLNIGPGVEVDAGAVEPPDGFELVTRPAGRAVVHLHVGAYEALPDVYRKLYDTMTRDGLEEAGEPIEIYETHGPVPETRIFWPVS